MEQLPRDSKLDLVILQYMRTFENTTNPDEEILARFKLSYQPVVRLSRIDIAECNRVLKVKSFPQVWKYPNPRRRKPLKRCIQSSAKAIANCKTSHVTVQMDIRNWIKTTREQIPAIGDCGGQSSSASQSKGDRLENNFENQESIASTTSDNHTDESGVRVPKESREETTNDAKSHQTSHSGTRKTENEADNSISLCEESAIEVASQGEEESFLLNRYGKKVFVNRVVFDVRTTEGIMAGLPSLNNSVTHYTKEDMDTGLGIFDKVCLALDRSDSDGHEESLFDYIQTVFGDFSPDSIRKVNTSKNATKLMEDSYNDLNNFDGFPVLSDFQRDASERHVDDQDLTKLKTSTFGAHAYPDSCNQLTPTSCTCSKTSGTNQRLGIPELLPPESHSTRYVNTDTPSPISVSSPGENQPSGDSEDPASPDSDSQSINSKSSCDTRSSRQGPLPPLSSTRSAMIRLETARKKSCLSGIDVGLSDGFNLPHIEQSLPVPDQRYIADKESIHGRSAFLSRTDVMDLLFASPTLNQRTREVGVSACAKPITYDVIVPNAHTCGGTYEYHESRQPEISSTSSSEEHSGRLVIDFSSTESDKNENILSLAEKEKGEPSRSDISESLSPQLPCRHCMEPTAGSGNGHVCPGKTICREVRMSSLRKVLYPSRPPQDNFHQPVRSGSMDHSLSPMILDTALQKEIASPLETQLSECSFPSRTKKHTKETISECALIGGIAEADFGCLECDEDPSVESRPLYCGASVPGLSPGPVCKEALNEDNRTVHLTVPESFPLRRYLSQSDSNHSDNPDDHSAQTITRRKLSQPDLCSFHPWKAGQTLSREESISPDIVIEPSSHVSSNHQRGRPISESNPCKALKCASDYPISVSLSSHMGHNTHTAVDSNQAASPRESLTTGPLSILNGSDSSLLTQEMTHQRPEKESIHQEVVRLLKNKIVNIPPTPVTPSKLPGYVPNPMYEDITIMSDGDVVEYPTRTGGVEYLNFSLPSAQSTPLKYVGTSPMNVTCNEREEPMNISTDSQFAPLDMSTPQERLSLISKEVNTPERPCSLELGKETNESRPLSKDNTTALYTRPTALVSPQTNDRDSCIITYVRMPYKRPVVKEELVDSSEQTSVNDALPTGHPAMPLIAVTAVSPDKEQNALHVNVEDVGTSHGVPFSSVAPASTTSSSAKIGEDCQAILEPPTYRKRPAATKQPGAKRGRSRKSSFYRPNCFGPQLSSAVGQTVSHTLPYRRRLMGMAHEAMAPPVATLTTIPAGPSSLYHPGALQYGPIQPNFHEPIGCIKQHPGMTDLRRKNQANNQRQKNNIMTAPGRKTPAQAVSNANSAMASVSKNNNIQETGRSLQAHNMTSDSALHRNYAGTWLSQKRQSGINIGARPYWVPTGASTVQASSDNGFAAAGPYPQQIPDVVGGVPFYRGLIQPGPRSHQPYSAVDKNIANVQMWQFPQRLQYMSGRQSGLIPNGTFPLMFPSCPRQNYPHVSTQENFTLTTVSDFSSRVANSVVYPQPYFQNYNNININQMSNYNANKLFSRGSYN